MTRITRTLSTWALAGAAVWLSCGTAAAASPPAKLLQQTFSAPAIHAKAASVYIDGQSVYALNADTPLVTASTAKIMTGYVLLKDRPFALSSTFAISRTQVQATKAGIQENDFEMPVSLGERLTGFQLLDAALIRSYDNAAQWLAERTPGGASHFVALMNATARAMGLTTMHFGGPAGLSTADRSSARDMTRLAMAAMQLPQFASIVSSPYITLPHTGKVPNVDLLLSKDPLATGIKTGWLPESGPNIVFSATDVIGGQKVQVTGTIFHDDSWHQMYLDAEALISAGMDAATQTIGRTGRGAFVADLAGAMGLSDPASAADHTFSDVPASSPYFGAIQAAYQAGWARGFSAVSFGVDAPVTRAEAAKFEVLALGKGAQAQALSGARPPFVDWAKIPAWADGYVAEAAQLGLFGGFPDGTFRPDMPLIPRVSTAALTKFRVALAHEGVLSAASGGRQITP